MPGYEFFGKEEKEAVDNVFKESNGILYRYAFDKQRNGIYRVKQFEEEFAKKIGSRYAHAVSSGSAALKCALQAMGVGQGDEVIIPGFTFIATAEAVCEVGATPVVVDIDMSLNMFPKALESAITERTKVIIPVHMLGAPCDMDAIIDISERYNLLVLEDNAQAPGGTYKGKYLGTFGDAGIFSFDGGKMLTTGEGGMIVTDIKRIFRRARGFSDHGHADTAGVPRGEDDILGFGFNYKMMELQGAIGLAQLKKMDYIIGEHKKRKEIWKQVFDSLSFVQTRKIHDVQGDISDSFCFTFVCEEHAKEFAKAWRACGYGTKNLPDAMRWHFAGQWYHLPLDIKMISIRQLLSCTIAVPINGLTDLKEVKTQATKARAIITSMYEKRK
jgi:8-amino-3,8-dideoxy-alpha-D-manno-octulosonate transaminase